MDSPHPPSGVGVGVTTPLPIPPPTPPVGRVGHHAGVNPAEGGGVTPRRLGRDSRSVTSASSPSFVSLLVAALSVSSPSPSLSSSLPAWVVVTATRTTIPVLSCTTSVARGRPTRRPPVTGAAPPYSPPSLSSPPPPPPLPSPPSAPPPAGNGPGGRAVTPMAASDTACSTTSSMAVWPTCHTRSVPSASAVASTAPASDAGRGRKASACTATPVGVRKTVTGGECGAIAAGRAPREGGAVAVAMGWGRRTSSAGAVAGGSAECWTGGEVPRGNIAKVRKAMWRREVATKDADPESTAVFNRAGTTFRTDPFRACHHRKKMVCSATVPQLPTAARRAEIDRRRSCARL